MGYVSCLSSGCCVRGDVRLTLPLTLAPVASRECAYGYPCDAAAADADDVPSPIPSVTSRGGAGSGLCVNVIDDERAGDARCVLGEGYGGTTGGSSDAPRLGYV